MATLLKFLSAYIRESVIEGMQENLFSSAKLVAAFEPLLVAIINGEEEGFEFRNEALRGSWLRQN